MAGDRTVRREELRRCNGDHGRPRFVAFRGVVYNVSDCPQWRREFHQGQHFAGQDLTAEMEDAPHGPEVLGLPCVRRIGPLLEE
jgi:predicted heme/steroid binding protein